MYFSIFKLDMENPKVCRSISDGYLMHQYILEDIFQCTRTEGGILYGVHEGNLYVKSEIPPKFPNASPFDYIKTIDISDHVQKHWKNGTVFHFMMNTTPHWRDHDPDTDKKRPHYYKTPEERARWLTKKLENGGANLISFREVSKKDIVVSNKENKKNPNYKPHVTQWTYSGTIQITDEEKFKETYAHGIGNQFIYGNGLLVLSW